MVRKDKPRPRSRSVYTSKSHVSDGSGSIRDLKYDGAQWIPRVIPSKSLYVDEYNVSIKSRFKHSLFLKYLSYLF